MPNRHQATSSATPVVFGVVVVEAFVGACGSVDKLRIISSEIVAKRNTASA